MVVITEVIRHWHSPPPPKIISKVDIPQNKSKNVAMIASYLQSTGSLELSSPETNYSYKLEKVPGKHILNIKHQKIDHERRKTTKDTITALEERIRAMEEVEKQRKFQEETISAWETCDRIAQGIDDFLKRVVHNTSNQDPLKRAKRIWAEKTDSYQNLSILFTTWWVYWNSVNPNEYPLPSVLDSLPPRDRKRYDPEEALPTDLDLAVEALWESRYQSLIELMLTAYHARPQTRNTIQHPIPSTDFAHRFLRSSKSLSNLSNKNKRVVSTLIDFGINKRDRADLFFHPVGSAGTSNFKQLDKKLEAILRESTPINPRH